jgi:hypothetical protein
LPDEHVRWHGIRNFPAIVPAGVRVVSEAPDVRLDRVVQAIARYLEQHPGAADSDDGIAKWWLPTLNVEASSQEVRVALEVLMRAGLVESVRIANQPPIWRASGSGSANGTSQ